MIVGLSLGSFFWKDDAWPFAPMRQFAWSPKDYVWSLALDATLADGRVVRMPFDDFHLRRAEAEGQMTRLEANPRLLKDLMDEYNRRVGPEERILRMKAIKRSTPVVNGRPVLRQRVQPLGREAQGPPIGLDTKLRVIAEWPPAK